VGQEENDVKKLQGENMNAYDDIEILKGKIERLESENRKLVEFINFQANEYEDCVSKAFLRKNRKYIIQYKD
jgi:hypothetical protein